MPADRSIPCTVLILTRNSADSLEKCIQNLSPFGEVLIHDANSEDESRAIAKRFGARVEKQYDTDEKNVRITDFTEMRLKQRADAKYDWVFYIDSDEFLSDELVTELSELIPTLDPKTIIKVPRFSIIDGLIRTHGLYYPELMPRIHHRKSGATLKKGKVVHEKYVYDDTFDVVVAKNPIYVPLDPIADLLRKDDFYIALEGKRAREERYTWNRYIRWVLWREPLVMLSISLRILKNLPLYLQKNRVPFMHDWRYVRYHGRLFLELTKAKFGL